MPRGWTAATPRPVRQPARTRTTTPLRPDPRAAAAAAPRPSMRQDLYHAVIAADGSVAETRLATDVCFCCKTATLVPPAPLAGATLAGDVLVAWRHIYPNSERDIALAVRTAKTGLFAPPVRVSADRWQLQACPDDGPALAASGTGRLHAVWPSIADPAAATPEKAIYHARSTDGRTFTPRRRLDAPGSGAAHPQVAAGADGDALALWDASGEGGRRVIALPLSEPGTPDRPRPWHLPRRRADAARLRGRVDERHRRRRGDPRRARDRVALTPQIT